MEIKTYFDKKIGVAVSGGADSMALLNLYKNSSQKFCVINIEHGIRGESSLADSDFVKNYCESYGIEYMGFFVDTLGECAKITESVELVARKLRYEVFDKLIDNHTVDLIALAHHKNDQAETIFMRIMRGTGIRGLAGIVDSKRYIHPLIKYTRQDIENYCAENNINYCTDESNFLSDYTRNYIRNEVFPVVNKRFTTYLTSMEKLSDIALEVDDYLRQNIIKPKVNNGVYVLERIFEYHTIVQKYSIREVLKDLGCVQNVEQRHLEYILSLKNKPNNTSFDLTKNIVVSSNNGDLWLYKKTEEKEFLCDFDINNTYSFGGVDYSFSFGKSIINGVSLDYDKLPAGCVVRNFRIGDKFKRVNGHTKKLSDYYNQLKLSSLQKNTQLLLAKDNIIFAILGVETSDKTKIDENTKNIININRRDCL